MFDLILHEASFARIADELKVHETALHPIVMNDEGQLSAAWGEPLGDYQADKAGPSIVYGTQDAFFGPAQMAFFTHIFSLPEISWCQISAAGTEHPALQAIGAKADIYTGSHEQSGAIGDWVLWAGLDWFQGGAERRSRMIDKHWYRMNARELSETKWLIIGYGHIGREVARRLKTFGAHVTGVRRSAGTDKYVDDMVHPGKLVDVLVGADAVLMCCPLTEDTKGMADADFFSSMKEGALFMNVGRGGLVDETALLTGLDAGRPGHAALDVVSEEPLPRENPIWEHPAITLTPHISALSEGSKRRTDQVFLRNLGAFLTGKPMQNVVDASIFKQA